MAETTEVRRSTLLHTASIGVTILALLAGLSLILPQQARASHTVNHIYYAAFKNTETQMCLEVLNYYVHNGAPVVLHPCTGGANQRWKVYYYNNGDSRFVNVHSGKCLEVVNYYVHPGAKIVQWDCHAGGNQLWRGRDFRYDPSRGFRSKAFANKHSQLCLDAPSRTKFTQVQQLGCNGTPWQQWSTQDVLLVWF